MSPKPLVLVQVACLVCAGLKSEVKDILGTPVIRKSLT